MISPSADQDTIVVNFKDPSLFTSEEFEGKALHKHFQTLTSYIRKQIPDTAFTNDLKIKAEKAEQLMTGILVMSFVFNLFLRGSAMRYMIMMIRSL